jgi:hypothetical protein
MITLRIFRRAGAPLLVVALALSTARPLAAQGSIIPDSVSVNDLVVSTAPAFILLGKEPTTVQRPTTTRGFKATLLSAANSEDGLPGDFAIEVTPFWLRPQPRFTVDSYFNSGFLTRIARSASIAVASTKDELEDGTSRTNIAGSFRTQLYSPTRAPRSFADRRRRLSTEIGKCTANPATFDDCIGKVKQSKDFTTLISDIERPTGLTIELASGVSGAAATDDAESLRWRRVGVWLTPMWTISGRLEAIGVARYLRERSFVAGEQDRGAFDYGGRILLRPTRALGVSAEAVGRRYDKPTAMSDRTSNRYGALLEYALNEQWFLFYALGRDFAAADVPRSPLLSRLGLNLGLGRSPRVTIP